MAIYNKLKEIANNLIFIGNLFNINLFIDISLHKIHVFLGMAFVELYLFDSVTKLYLNHK